MDSPADQHQDGQLANRKSKKGRKEEEGKRRMTPGEEFQKDLKDLLVHLSTYITREVVFRTVLFFVVYFTLTRFNIIVTFLFNIFSNE